MLTEKDEICIEGALAGGLVLLEQNILEHIASNIQELSIDDFEAFVKTLKQIKIWQTEYAAKYVLAYPESDYAKNVNAQKQKRQKGH